MTGLTALIIERIAKQGPIPFSQFMDLALYHPEMGYYSTGKPFAGQGDFYTGPALHPVFGWTVARFLCQHLDEPHILEIGPGKGFLASDILNYVFSNQPQIYQNLRYYLLERSPALIKQQRSLLEQHRHKVKWIDSLEQVKGFKGIMVANELLDAMAFDRFLRDKGRWFLMGVAWEEGFKWTKLHQVQEDFLPDEAPDGTVYDVSVQGLEFLSKCHGVMSRGSGLLLVDYGYTRQHILDLHPKGTLTCYYQHSISSDPFIRVGQQDITYFLDWDLVKQVAKQLGFELRYEASQAEFLTSAGIQKVLEHMSVAHSNVELMKARLAVKNLLLTFRNYKVFFWVKN